MMKANCAMMRTILRMSLIVCIAVLASCSHDDGGSEGADGEQQFHLNIVDGDESNTMPNGATVGLFIYDESTGTYVSTNSLLIVGNGGVSYGTSTIPTLGSYTFYAYSPYNESWTDIVDNPHRFDAKTSQARQADYTASDLILATGKMSGDNTTMDFRHVMTRIVVHITDQTGQYDLSESAATGVSLRSMATGVLFTLKDGIISTFADERTDVTPLMLDQTERRMSVAAIVAPQTKTSSEDFVKVTIGGKIYNYNPINGTEQLEGGKSYVYRLLLTKTGIVPDGSYVTNWENDGTNTILQGE